MKRKLILIVLFSGVLLVGANLWFVSKPVEPEKEEIAAQEKAILILNYGDENEKSYTIDLGTLKGATAFSLLENVCNREGLKLDSEKSSFGILVKTIGPKTNTNSQYWLYEVNGKIGEVSADKFAIKNDDQVRWQYGQADL